MSIDAKMAFERETWDGKPVSREPPFGASVIVYRWNEAILEFLLLHRSQIDRDSDDRAWTPPSGTRLPSESIMVCAQRELLEETGLKLPIRCTEHGSGEWAVYAAEAPAGVDIVFDEEHDRFEWVAAGDAALRCRPEVVAAQVGAVARSLGGARPIDTRDSPPG